MTVLLVVIYAGDVTASIKSCGTRCPYRITDDGNTELLIEAHAKVKTLEEAATLMQMCGTVDEAKTHGEILDLQWFSKLQQGEATEAKPLNCEEWAK